MGIGRPVRCPQNYRKVSLHFYAQGRPEPPYIGLSLLPTSYLRFQARAKNSEMTSYFAAAKRLEIGLIDENMQLTE